MAGLYFLALALLVLAAFVIGRSRARGLAGAGSGGLHSLPTYHGLFTAVGVLVPMLLVYLVAAPLIGRLATSNALDAFGPDVVGDALRRSAVLRDVHNLATGQYGDGEPTPALKSAAESYASTLTYGQWLLFAGGVVLGLSGLMLCLGRISANFRSRNLFERFVLVTLMACAGVAILTTLGIVFSVLFETYRFF